MKKSRVNLIARDQIGKLNSMATQARMQNVGLNMYIWETAHDERVRSTHVPMDGKLCQWDNPRVYSDDGGKTWIPRSSGWVHLHPGMSIQCRCIATAYWEELIGEIDLKIANEEDPAMQFGFDDLDQFAGAGFDSEWGEKAGSGSDPWAAPSPKVPSAKTEWVKPGSEKVIPPKAAMPESSEQELKSEYIKVKNENVSLKQNVDEKVAFKEPTPKPGESWGIASSYNWEAMGFTYVNSKAYYPVDEDTGKLIKDFFGKVNVENVQLALDRRAFAQEQIKNVIASREEMPYFLRGEKLKQRDYDKMIKSGYRDLTGMTATTANDAHNKKIMEQMAKMPEKDDVFVRFHILRTDELENMAGMVVQEDYKTGNIDETRPDEIDFGGNKMKIEKQETVTVETSWGGKMKINDVWCRIEE
jgi:hypothetical protein